VSDPLTDSLTPLSVPSKGSNKSKGVLRKCRSAAFRDADREVLDDLSGGGREGVVARIPAVNVIKASVRLVSALFAEIIQSN
jgi:hypothetical protein